MSPPQAQFRRDRYTWLSYGLLGYFAYLQTALGPLMPFLRAELNLSYTLSGLHFSAFALGMILAGLWTDAVSARFGRAITYWGGGLGMALAALLFAAGRRIEITLLAACLMSSLGTMLVIMIQSTLSEQHGLWRARSLTEANLAAGIASGIAPIMVGLSVSTAIGWRGALVLAILLWLLIYLGAHRFGIRIPIAAVPPRNEDPTISPRQRLPRRFWLIWVVTVCCVSIEWCVIYWGATFLEESVGLSRELAASAMGIYFLGGIFARFTGSQLTRRYDAAGLLIGALFLSALAFPLFWLGGSMALSLIGLFILGLGASNLFPFALVVALAVGASTVDRASARISFGSGTAALITPQLLGSLADSVGIARAFSVIVVLQALAFILFWWMRRGIGMELKPAS